MKALVNIFLLNILSSLSLAQSNTQQQLPIEVAEYYQKTNIVMAFSSHEERSFLTKLINSDEALPEFKEDRVEYIYDLIQDIVYHTDPGDQMPNSMAQNSWKLSSSELLGINSWEFREDALIVKVNKYSLPSDINARLISNYDEYRRHSFKALKETLESQLPLSSISVQSWRNTNGDWVRDNVEMVLVE